MGFDREIEAMGPRESRDPSGGDACETVLEISGQFTDVVAIAELRGSYPNVPILPDIDYADLIAGDPDPLFVTLPVGKANVVSGNKRFYDAAWLQELERQIVELRPIGLMGHLSDAQRATEFPQESLHWVGAMAVDNVLWGKAYLAPNGPAKERLKRYKASGKSIATSIDALASGTWDESIQAYRMDAKTLKLGQIDLAPSDRAGVGALARVPMLTTEMAETHTTEVVEIAKENPEMDRLQVIQELTEADARLLPDPVRAAVLATVATPAEVAMVTAIRETLGLAPTADVAGHIAEMQRVQEEQAKAAVAGRIKELVNAGIQLEDVRPIVTELIAAHHPATVEAAEAVYKTVAESESVKNLLAARVVETMGPKQRTPVQSKSGSKYFQIPAAE